MWNWGHVLDGGDLEAGRGQRLDGRLAAAARALHQHVHLAHAQVHRLAPAVLGGDGGGERGRLLGALEARLAGGAPGEGIAPHVGDRDQDVVEGGRNVGDAFGLDHLLATLCTRSPGRSRIRHGLLLGDFLLARDGPTGALLGASVGMGTLAAHGQSPAVPGATIGADVHQALDVHRHLGPEAPLHLDRALDQLAQPGHLGVTQVAHPRVRTDPGVGQQLRAGRPADAKDVGQRDLHTLFPGKVHPCNACHDQPCRCLCLGFRLQITRTTPCRRITLQCSQIGLTLDRTFTPRSRR